MASIGAKPYQRSAGPHRPHMGSSGVLAEGCDYRRRWQIELAFKRLKSLLQLGHLKKVDKEGAKAWLQGKLLVACLIETLILTAERFSPWGYRTGERGLAVSAIALA